MSIPDYVYTAGAMAFGGLGIGAFAVRRGRSFLWWLLFGAMVPIVALPWLLLTKSDRQPSDPPPAGMLPLAIMSGIAFVALIGIQFASAPATIPTCDGYFAQSDLKNVVANSPAGKAAGLAIVTLTDINEVSKTSSEIRCTATSRLNNASVVSMNYRFFIESGKLLVEARWSPVSGG
ncbi:hypothetical protein [Bradyrhizobium australafricanum]|uniref:hypothetical protein n=1 Tax=Bradyrhizobium australafricanum TaxID=2821406 RepID=UPI001CE240F8|nr:hypothetical protein [Bradyrhizobium australafricanum]MCA6099173.1 hypothetical protein [Bradyrhizobium australafricanum]